MTNPVALALADFRERSRRYNFIVTLASMLYAAYVFMPERGANYVTIDLDGYRGVYNSAWVGGGVAMLATVFLSLIGFYVVKSAIERDRLSRVGEVLATTRMSSLSYLSGKWLSHLFVFAAMLAVLVVAAAAMQWIRAEDTTIRPLPLLLPFVLVTLPALAVTAAFAILFETIRPLSGSAGNVVWFFGWTLVFLNPAILNGAIAGRNPPSWADAGGTSIIVSGMMDDAGQAIAGYERKNFTAGLSIGSQNSSTFVWDGVEWSAPLVLARLIWLPLAFLLVLAAVPFFDRFDPARRGLGKAGRRHRKRVDDSSDLSAFDPALPGSPALEAMGGLPAVAPAVRSLAPAPATRFQLLPLIGAEVRLLLKGYGWWWYFVLLALFVAGAVAPIDVARRIWPISWIWPLPVFAALGSRDVRSGTAEFLRSSPHPLRRQLSARILAGWIVALLAGLAVGIRLAIGGEAVGLLAWAGGALFVSSFAVASGIWTGSSRLFEVLYLLLWYMGPMHLFHPLDFMGVTTGVDARSATLLFAMLALPLIALATVGEIRRLRSG